MMLPTDGNEQDLDEAEPRLHPFTSHHFPTISWTGFIHTAYRIFAALLSQCRAPGSSVPHHARSTTSTLPIASLLHCCHRLTVLCPDRRHIHCLWQMDFSSRHGLVTASQGEPGRAAWLFHSYPSVATLIIAGYTTCGTAYSWSQAYALCLIWAFYCFPT